MSVVKSLALALGAVSLAACSKVAIQPDSIRPPPTGAGSPAAAAKQWYAAIARSDVERADAMSCRHGWTGTEGFQVSVPGGPHRLIAKVRRVDGSWAVTIIARASDGASSSSNAVPFRVVRQGKRYFVCGYVAG